MSALDIDVLRTWILPEYINVGCTTCGAQAVEMLIAVSEHETEWIEAHCRACKEITQ